MLPAGGGVTFETKLTQLAHVGSDVECPAGERAWFEA